MECCSVSRNSQSDGVFFLLLLTYNLCFHHMVSHGQGATWRSPSLSRSNTWPLSSSWNPSAHLVLVFELWRYSPSDAVLTPAISPLTGRLLEGGSVLFLPVQVQRTCPLPNHVTTEEANAKIQQAIGPHEDLLTVVKRRKLSGMDMSPVHQVWPKPSCKEQWKGGKDKADWNRGGKTTSRNGQAWSSPSPRRRWRTQKNGGNWF